MAIENKVIAITGASSGIGEGTARLLAARGARLMLGARRTDRLAALADELNAAGGQVAFRALDVTDRADVEAFVAATEAEFGRIDVLVSNAGLMPLSRFDSLKVEEWDRMIDVNIRGVLHGIPPPCPASRPRAAAISSISRRSAVIASGRPAASIRRPNMRCVPFPTGCGWNMTIFA